MVSGFELEHDAWLPTDAIENEAAFHLLEPLPEIVTHADISPGKQLALDVVARMQAAQAAREAQEGIPTPLEYGVNALKRMLDQTDPEVRSAFSREVIESAKTEAQAQPGSSGQGPGVRNAIADSAQKALLLRPIQRGEQ